VVTALLLALTWAGREYAWTSPQILALAAVVAVAGALLYRAERQAVEPVIPGSLLRGNVLSLSTIASFGNSLVWFGLIFLVPVRLQMVLGESATVAGALLTPGIVLGPVSAFIAGQIMSRTGRYRFTSLTAGAFQVTGLSLLLWAPTSSPVLVTFFFLLASIGTGFGGPTFLIVYQNAIPRRQLGAGTGLLSLFRQFGAAVGTALAGSIVGVGAAAGGGSAVAQAVQRGHGSASRGDLRQLWRSMHRRAPGGRQGRAASQPGLQLVARLGGGPRGRILLRADILRHGVLHERRQRLLGRLSLAGRTGAAAASPPSDRPRRGRRPVFHPRWQRRRVDQACRALGPGRGRRCQGPGSLP